MRYTIFITYLNCLNLRKTYRAWKSYKLVIILKQKKTSMHCKKNNLKYYTLSTFSQEGKALISIIITINKRCHHHSQWPETIHSRFPSINLTREGEKERESKVLKSQQTKPSQDKKKPALILGFTQHIFPSLILPYFTLCHHPGLKIGSANSVTFPTFTCSQYNFLPIL